MFFLGFDQIQKLKNCSALTRIDPPNNQKTDNYLSLLSSLVGDKSGES